MDDFDPRLIEVFYDVQRGLPRQGPGNKASTIKALDLCTSLSNNPDILDMGCGPGMQTMALAEATTGNLVAVDNCREYLDQLTNRLNVSGLMDRVDVRNDDMVSLRFPDGSFDLIWCEGAAYNLGVSEALKSWRPFLRESGYLAFTELAWLEENPDATVKQFFQTEYPAMTNVDGVKEIVRETGFQLVDDFTLPNSAWWDDYYTPLESKLPSLKQIYADDDEALAIIANTETEIEMRRRFPESYGYQFFITKK